MDIETIRYGLNLHGSIEFAKDGLIRGSCFGCYWSWIPCLEWYYDEPDRSI